MIKIIIKIKVNVKIDLAKVFWTITFIILTMQG